MNNINELEKLRKDAMIYNILLIGLGLAFFYSAIIINEIGSAMVIMVFILISIFLSNSASKKYKKAFKEFFVKKALNSLLTNLEYQPEYGLSRDLIRGTNLLNTGDVFTSNDYIKGTYKGVNLEFSDIHIQEKRGSGKDRRYVTIFRGSWMIFSFNKKFKSNVRLVEKAFPAALGNGLFGGNKYINVQMEDMEFNDRFITQAYNELDAFYIMTPHMMQKVKDLSSKSKSTMMFGFIDNNLHIANSSNKDNFEPSIFKKINEEEIIDKINSDIVEITQFVEDLDLDNNLFK